MSRQEEQVKVKCLGPCVSSIYFHLCILHWQRQQERWPKWKHSPHPATRRLCNWILQIHRAESGEEKNVYPTKRSSKFINISCNAHITVCKCKMLQLQRAHWERKASFPNNLGSLHPRTPPKWGGKQLWKADAFYVWQIQNMRVC